MKTEKRKKHRPILNKVMYTSSSSEIGICSLSHVNTYLLNLPLLLTLKHSHLICSRHAGSLTKTVSRSGTSGLTPEISKGLHQSMWNSWRNRSIFTCCTCLHTAKLIPR